MPQIEIVDGASEIISREVLDALSSASICPRFY